MRIIDIVGALIASVELLRPHCDRRVPGYLSPLEAALQLGSDIVLLLKRFGTAVFSVEGRVAKGLQHSLASIALHTGRHGFQPRLHTQPRQLKVRCFSFHLETV